MRVGEKKLRILLNNSTFYKKSYYRLPDVLHELKPEKGLFLLLDEKENLLGLSKVKELFWDRKIFGFNCGRIEYLIFRKEVDDILKEIFIREILKRNKNKRFLDISIEEKDKKLRKILLKLGFKEMVKYVTYHIRLPIKFSNSLREKIEVAKKEDLVELEKISAHSFFNTRFYKDKNFKRKLIEKFYKEWIRNSFNNKKEHQIFVYKINNKVIGFINCRILKLSKRKIGIIDLIAVEKKYRGKGIGKNLVKKGLEYFQRKRVKEVYVETEKENLSALRLYKSLGMRIVGKRNTFHFWYGEK
ncbi:MAG: GNAT family N-acetyltransferase [candidate division WOR-3 bacterium]|nr:GNAT family N-acetyltransferase [candidate division WOR-3 bacterium]MDW8113696.1 GNAT family N-acetyltransferase [candidate division WOR-3 bacterium]